MQAFLKVKWKTSHSEFSTCVVFISGRKEALLAKWPFHIELGHQIHGSLAGTLPSCFHHRRDYGSLHCLPLSPSQYSALGNYNQLTGASLQNETYFAP